MSKTNRSLLALMITVLTSTCVLFKSGCGSYAGNPEEDEEDENLQMVSLPDVRSIDLSNLGRKASLRLADSAKQPCDEELNLGIFGLPIGAACHTSAMANGIIYGSAPDRDNDNALTCADYKSDAEDGGILAPLLCEKGLLKTPRLQSLRFVDEKSQNVAISFADFDPDDNLTALGNWTAKGEDSGRYPANIRFWSGQPKLKRLLALSLSDGKNGQLAMDFNINNYPGLLTSDFTAPADATACSSTPGEQTCFSQNIKLKTYGDPNTLIPGVTLRILADTRENPSFVIIEGKFSYPAEVAEKLFASANGSPESFKKIREIYVRSVQKGTQIWGTFDFKDETGATIQTPMITENGVVDFTKVLKDGVTNAPYSGVCQNRGTDAQVACTEINYTDYAGVWKGDAAIAPVLPEFDITIDFSNPPVADGIVQVP